MEKLLIFPYNSDTETLIKNQDLFVDFKLIALSSYQEDTIKFQNVKERHDVYCDSDFGRCCNLVEAVLFADNTMGYDVEGYQERINIARDHQLKIYMSSILAIKLGLLNKIEEYGILLLDKFKQLNDDFFIDKELEVEVPVISVMGLGENCDKFKFQIIIRKELKKLGYNVLSISSNTLGSFLGMEVFPDFLFSKEYSFTEKIRRLNHWIVKLERKKKPDLIILGCPGGVLPLNELCTNFYGEIPLVVANAVVSDLGIMSLYKYFAGTDQSLERLKQLCQFRYNISVQDFFVSEKYYKNNFEASKIDFYEYNKEKHDSDSNSNILINKLLYEMWDIDNYKGVKDNITRILNGFKYNINTV